MVTEEYLQGDSLLPFSLSGLGNAFLNRMWRLKEGTRRDQRNVSGNSLSELVEAGGVHKKGSIAASFSAKEIGTRMKVSKTKAICTQTK